MKAICSFCGHANRADAADCVQCGGNLAEARRESIAGKLALRWLPPFLCALFLGADTAWDRSSPPQRIETTKPLDAEQAGRAKLEADFQRHEAEQEALHSAQLADPQFTSGAQAAGRHAEEWKRRQNHDPAFAASLLEETLVEVEKLGKDPSLTAETALKRVAAAVAPTGSRIEVTPVGDRFVVRIAFRMSTLRPNEAGDMTQHTSSPELRKEVQEMSAYLLRDLFDFCGSRGIERLSVSCNRALTERDDQGQDRLMMRSLFRVSIDAATASKVANWRSLPIPQVIALTKVEHDMISRIFFTDRTRNAIPLDPNQPLEF